MIENTVYISNQLRTNQTTDSLLIGEKRVIRTDLLNEIPLTAFMNTIFRLPTFIWMVIGRLQWYFNCSKQLEVREKSKGRIIAFLDYIERKQQDCIIIGYGFYFTQMVIEMKGRGIVGNMKKRIRNEELESLFIIEFDSRTKML